MMAHQIRVVYTAEANYYTSSAQKVRYGAMMGSWTYLTASRKPDHLTDPAVHQSAVHQERHI